LISAVSARRSATSTLPGRPPCAAGGVYGRSSPVSLCSLRGPPGALDSDLAAYMAPAGPGTDYQLPFDHQNCRSFFSFKRQLKTHLFQQLWVSCTVVRRCCDHSEFGAGYRCPDSRRRPYTSRGEAKRHGPPGGNTVQLGQKSEVTNS